MPRKMQKPTLASRARIRATIRRESATSPALLPYIRDVSGVSPDAWGEGEFADLESKSRQARVNVLLDRMERNDQRAFEQFVVLNLPLVIGIAVRFAGKGVPLLDLIQEGNIALMRAARSYDRTRAAFSTHAAWIVFQACQRTIPEQGRTIPITPYMDEQRQIVHRVQREARDAGEDELDAATIVTRTGLSPVTVKSVLSLAGTISLETPVRTTRDGDAFLTLGETLNTGGEFRDDDWHSPTEDVVLARDGLHDLRRAWRRAGLSPRQKEVLALCFGLGDSPALPPREVAARLGITRSAVHEQRAEGLIRLRHAMLRLQARRPGKGSR